MSCVHFTRLLVWFWNCLKKFGTFSSSTFRAPAWDVSHNWGIDTPDTKRCLPSIIFWLGRCVTDYLGDWTDGGPKERSHPHRHGRIYTKQTAIDCCRYAKVQHDNHKVAIVKDCDAIPGHRRTLGPQRGDYYGRWSRRYTRRRQAAQIVVFSAHALQSQSCKSTQDGELCSLNCLLIFFYILLAKPFWVLSIY